MLKDRIAETLKHIVKSFDFHNPIPDNAPKKVDATKNIYINTLFFLFKIITIDATDKELTIAPEIEDMIIIINIIISKINPFSVEKIIKLIAAIKTKDI